MIVVETLDSGLEHTYSDEGYYILQETGIKYDEAYDVAGLHSYTETDELIEEEPATAEEILSILLGGETE